MKFFLFDAINRYKRWSESLDIGTILCNKSWQVFNDSGDKEIYIFQSDGSLIMSINGRVVNGTWSYIPANHSLVINGAGQSYMLHPAFMDNVVLALNMDGTQDYAFMIDENNTEAFAPKSYSALLGYFAEKERNRLLDEERAEKVRREQIAQEESLQREKEQRFERQRQVDELKNRILLDREKIYTRIFFFIWLPSYLIINFVYLYMGDDSMVLSLAYGGAVVVLLFMLFIIWLILGWLNDRRIHKWKKEHPDDWRAQYL